MALSISMLASDFRHAEKDEIEWMNQELAKIKDRPNLQPSDPDVVEILDAGTERFKTTIIEEFKESGIYILLLFVTLVLLVSLIFRGNSKHDSNKSFE